MLCAIVILLGLAAHLIADATCVSPDLAGVSQRSATGRQVTTCSLLAGLVLPEITVVGTLLTVVLVLVSVNLTLSFWYSSPLVHPPILLR